MTQTGYPGDEALDQTKDDPGTKATPCQCGKQIGATRIRRNAAFVSPTRFCVVLSTIPRCSCHWGFLMRMSLTLVALMLLAMPAGAADHFVAPRGATATCPATGSEKCPWPSLEAAFASKKIVGGDTVLLMDGDHDGVRATRWTFETMVTIQSANKSNARISNITFPAEAKNIRLRNLKVWRDEGDTGTSFLIRSDGNASHLTLENLEIRSREDSINYLAWDAARWVEVATRAVDLRGSFNIVRNNRITGVKEGIIAGTDSLVEGNIIDGIAGDGMKGVSRSTFRNNTVKNSVAVLEGYHRDGFQSHSSGNPIVGLRLENNTIIQWTHDPRHPLTAAIQGIGMFDGWYDDLVIQNNLVVTNHSHGISINGTRGAHIVNNTVVNLAGKVGNVPYLKVTSKKDGSRSRDVLVANNLAMQILVTASLPDNVVVVKNAAIVTPVLGFRDVKTFDYRPVPSSGWVDSGHDNAAPRTDILGLPRPSGAATDKGAYEVQVAGTKPVNPKEKDVAQETPVPAPLIKPVPEVKPTEVKPTGVVTADVKPAEVKKAEAKPIPLAKPAPTAPKKASASKALLSFFRFFAFAAPVNR